ncbi:unnamed protein product [Prunus armeniaca]|uniref:C3H1-type domain-containing protein n=1 Tax=Prunus armeniaca TaxID=36596 RepID=A0A6J5XJ21_PRUAR|nr:unnamed protein product [Prunus armeniaca]
MPAPPPYVMNYSVTETNAYEQRPQQKQVEQLPERPGQPACIYFSRTGDCKFISNCKYHHPKNQTALFPSCALSDKGLHLRPLPSDKLAMCTTKMLITSPLARTFADNTVPMAFAILGQLVNLTIRRYQLPFCNAVTTNGAGNIWK